MTDKEILEKSITRARGYKYSCIVFPDIMMLDNNYYRLIFSHDFAKAFWGEEKYKHWCEGYSEEVVENIPEKYKNCKLGENWKVYQPIWKYHLQQMVLEKEPLKYLKKFL